MTRARDVANVLSTATSLATDTETAAAISSHNTAANGHTTRGNTAGRPATPTTGDVYINTETGFAEIYTGATYGWEQVGGVASTPTSVVATNSGSGRAYNNGQASVAFSAGTIVGRTYTVTSSPGSYTATGSTSPLVVTGLQSNTQYTYTVTATNNYGTSSASSASSAVTATTVPQAPTIGTATASSASATLTFTEGSTGGSSITNYKYSTDSTTYTAFSPAQTTSPLTISGLTNGTSYSFYLKAVNANGDSAASGQSNSVTPAEDTSFESIVSTLVGAGGATSITFNDNGAWTPYKHLQLRIMARSDRGITTDTVILGFNGTTSSSSYASASYYASGSSINSFYETTSAPNSFTGIRTATIPASTSQGTTFGVQTIDILDFANVNKKPMVIGQGGYATANGTGSEVILWGGLYNSAGAITSIKVYPYGGSTLTQNSRISLYGIRG